MLTNSGTSDPAARRSDKWADDAATPTVRAFRTAVRRLVAERLAASGRAWEAAAVDPALELTTADLSQVEADLLATGYRFEASAQISVTESPTKYRNPATAAQPPLVGSATTDGDADGVVGRGDNVFLRSPDVEGTVLHVSSVERVMALLVEGVPAETVAVIDDAGGTLTAPVMESFTAILCRGGTIRSHLGILAREYGIPCLMATDVSGLNDGDRVRLETSKAPRDIHAEVVITAGGDRARVWRLP